MKQELDQVHSALAIAKEENSALHSMVQVSWVGLTSGCRLVVHVHVDNDTFSWRTGTRLPAAPGKNSSGTSF